MPVKSNVKPIATATSPSEAMLYQPVVPRADAVRIGWMYPYTYAVSMSSLGYLTLFQQLDQHPDVAVRRINTDTMASESISGMDMMGFSFSYELDIMEIIRMLDQLGVPLYQSQRGNDCPLVFAGGPVVMTNPEPYADFFDFFLIGEGEEILNDLVQAFQRFRHLTDRQELLKALAFQIPGLYVPSLYEVTYAPTGEITAMAPLVDGLPLPITKRWVENMDDFIASTPILTPDTVFSNTFLVEVMRGCAHRCRFCLASYSMLPARGPALQPILERIQFGLQYTRKIGLLGALIADHPQFEELCDFLLGVPDIQVSAASLRADTLTPHIAKTFHHGGQRTVTLAVETGSEKLRKRINKHLKTEAIEHAAAITAQAGIPELKLYTMIGLPDEDPSDLEDTVALVKRIKQANPRLKLSVGCSTFVPKAATPFQWLAREDTKTLEEKHMFLRKSLWKYADFRPSSSKWDRVQALLSRGDRRLSAWIVEFYKQGGNLGAVNRAVKSLQRVDLPALDWYALRKRPREEILPWDLLFLGVSKDTLYQESGLAKTNWGQAEGGGGR